MKRKLLSLLLAVFTFAVVGIRLSSHAPIARAASPSSIEDAASCSLFNLRDTHTPARLSVWGRLLPSAALWKTVRAG